MVSRVSLLCLFTFVTAAPVVAQDGAAHTRPPRSIQASALTGPITLDGRLDEPAWGTAEAATDFIQQQPKEGEPATQRTEVRFLFNHDALYVGARMYDDGGATYDTSHVSHLTSHCSGRLGPDCRTRRCPV